MVDNGDGTATITGSGHTVQLLVPGDTPGASATLNVGGSKATINVDGTWTVLSVKGRTTDLCAALAYY